MVKRSARSRLAVVRSSHFKQVSIIWAGDTPRKFAPSASESLATSAAELSLTAEASK